MAKKTAEAKAIEKDQRQKDAARAKLDKFLQDSGIGSIFSGSVQTGNLYCHVSGSGKGAIPASLTFKQGADGNWSIKFELYPWVLDKIEKCGFPLKSRAPKEPKAAAPAPKKAPAKKTTKPTLKLIEGPVASHGVDNG